MEEKEKFEFKSEALKEARETKGFKQEELAKKVFTTRQSISNWENGKKIPTLENVDRLATALGISIDDLIVRKVEERLNTNDEELVKHDSCNCDLVYSPIVKETRKNLKFFKIILALILILLIIYLGISIRKFVILYDIHKKMQNYINIDNYYLKTGYWELNSNNIIKYDNEIWRKEDKYKELLIFQEQVTTRYIFDNTMYTINNDTKEIIKNTNVNIDDYNNQIQGKLISNKVKNIKDQILNSFNFNFNFKITNANYYYISYNMKDENGKYRVEEKISKNTGLIEEINIQNENKSIIETYIFQPNIINETDVEMDENVKKFKILN